MSVDDGINSTAIRNQLNKILSSKWFLDSPRMARFLRYAAEETLHGAGQQLKESVIGHQVFDRPPDYDSRTDPIVRVEARRLRQKLSAYYEQEGKRDQLIIDLPKGQYAPVFRSQADVASTATAYREIALAVLPFTNLSPDNDFLSEGLTEDLISALTRISNLRVSAWTSASRMKDEQDDLEVIEARLGVQFVVRGSVRKTADRIRVSAHLIDTSTKRYVWSETFDRQLQDIFAIEDEITKAIVSGLATRVHVPNERVLPAGRTQNLESYELCVKGRFHSRERTPQGFRRSVLCFEKAIEIDPELVTAHVGLADTFALLAEYGLGDGPQYMQKAKTAIDRALALDPESAEAQASLGLILDLHDWSWKAAETAYLRSFELNANYAPAHHWYSCNHLAALDRMAEAEEQLSMARKLDPLSPLMMEGVGFLCLLRREYRAAIEAYRETIREDPSFYKAYTSMGRAYLSMGEHVRAVEMLEAGLSLAGDLPSILGALGQAYALAGRREEARRVLEKLRSMSTSRAVPFVCFAFVHLGLGEKERALDCLEQAAMRRESSVAWIRIHPGYDLTRDEPRFRALIERVFPGPAAVIQQ